MRDIRSDLQERATLINEQIRVAYDQFQKILEQLQNERDAKIADLKSELAMVAKFMEFEQRFLGNASPPAPPSPPAPRHSAAHSEQHRQATDLTRQERLVG